MRIFGWLLGATALGLMIFLMLGITPLGRGPFQSLFPVGDVQRIDFAQLGSVRAGAQWLVCPGFDLCRQSDDRTPIYDNSADQVKRVWDRMLREREPALELVLSDDALRQYTYVVRRAFLQLPDLVTVQFIPEGEARAKIAIFSRSVYPLGDFGSNATRVIRMMDYMDSNLSLYKR